MTSRPVALVTGAGSGIGLATVTKLIGQQWSVVALDRRFSSTSSDDQVAAIVGDVSDEQAINSAVDLALERFGRLDALVLNAGIAISGKIDEQSMDMFDEMMAVNLRGPALMVRAALPHLRKSANASIVAVGSIAAMGGDADLWAYGASKAGLLNLVKSLARALGPENIRINSISPGIVATPINEETRTQRPERARALEDAVPLLRWGKPEELANVIFFLISSEASYVNGVNIPVDGGLSATSGMPHKPRAATPR